MPEQEKLTSEEFLEKANIGQLVLLDDALSASGDTLICHAQRRSIFLKTTDDPVYEELMRLAELVESYREAIWGKVQDSSPQTSVDADDKTRFVLKHCIGDPLTYIALKLSDGMHTIEMLEMKAQLEAERKP